MTVLVPTKYERQVLKIEDSKPISGILTAYRLSHINSTLHREDGPAWSVKYDDGDYIEEYVIRGNNHRYGGPAYYDPKGYSSYFIHGECVDDIVLPWLGERGYEWETMTDVEKWELELFMRSIKNVE